MAEEDSGGLASEGIWRRWRSQPRILRWPINTVVTWLVLVLLIQVTASAPVVSEMPGVCPEGSLNCVRVADDGTSFRSESLQPPSISAQRGEVWMEIMNWLGQGFGSEILSSEQGQDSGTDWVHAEVRTQFWLFPDDVFAEIGCSAEGAEAVVTLQSQSRLGVGDLGENHQRLESLISHLEAKEWSSERCDEPRVEDDGI